MIDIARKKMPNPVVGLLVYLAFCASEFLIMRGTLAYFGEMFGLSKYIINDFVAFFAGGLVPFLIYWFVAAFVMRKLAFRIGAGATSIKYGVDLTVAAAGILLFLIKLVYLVVPLYSTIINAIIDPIIMLGAVSLYLLYAFKLEYVEKSKFRHVVADVLGMFAAVYAVLTFISLIMAV